MPETIATTLASGSVETVAATLALV
jgi:hypothetical protein